MRAAIYIRVSTGAQAGAGHVSLEVQEERCRAFIAERGGQVVGIERDTESGMKVTRQGYQRILELARAGAIDAVVVLTASRFGRRASEVLARIEELRERGVELHSTQEDLSNFLMTGITAVLNEEQSRVIGRLAGPARRRRAEQGFWVAHAPFGTTNNRGVLEATADMDALREVFRRAAAGEPILHIARWLNAGRARPYTREGVTAMLKNPAYVGFTRWAGETHQAQWTPFVDPDLWERAQPKRRGRSQAELRAERRQCWIVGLAYCVCGWRMHFSHLRAGVRRSRSYYYLECGYREYATGVQGCGARQVRLEVAEASVLAELRDDWFTSATLAQLATATAEAHNTALGDWTRRRADLTREKARLQERLDRADQGYLERVYDASRHATIVAGVNDAIAAIEEALRSPAPEPGIDVSMVQDVFGGDRWLRLAEEDPAAFNAVLSELIERINIPGGIVWKPGVRDVLR